MAWILYYPPTDALYVVPAETGEEAVKQLVSVEDWLEDKDLTCLRVVDTGIVSIYMHGEPVEFERKPFPVKSDGD